MDSKSPLKVACRRVGLDRIDELVAMEESCFDTDRIARRNLRRLLRTPSAFCAGAFCRRQLAGSMVVLFRRGSRIARIYSLAVKPTARGRGVAGCLLAQAEREACARGCARLRLEVRPDNTPAIQLYLRNGYLTEGRRTDFYEDGADALLMGKDVG